MPLASWPLLLYRWRLKAEDAQLPPSRKYFTRKNPRPAASSSASARQTKARRSIFFMAFLLFRAEGVPYRLRPPAGRLGQAPLVLAGDGKAGVLPGICGLQIG